jgi:ATP-dependent Lon protease
MGLREVILPRRNEKDIEDVPESVRDVMTFHLASRVEEAIDVALEPAVTTVFAAA